MPKFSYVYPLQELALVQIADAVWSNVRMVIVSKIEHMAPSLLPEFMQDFWEEMVDVVRNQIQELPLPSSLIVELEKYVKDMGWQIFLWVIIHKDNPCMEIKLPKKFYWSCEGSLEERLTAIVLIRDNTLEFASRYRLACFYCLEASIRFLSEARDYDILDIDMLNIPGLCSH